MIQSEALTKKSPFKITHRDATDQYNLTNSTPELIKFQLKMNQPQSTDLNSSILQDAYTTHLKNIAPSLSSSVSTLYDEEDTDSFVYSKSTKPNYLNLKILIENSMFDSSKIDEESIISLKELHEVKQKISLLTETKEYLMNRISIAQQFINDVVNEQLDTSTLMRILKTQSSLQSQLNSNNQELDSLNSKLNNHNISCLALGYIEDIREASAPSTAPSSPKKEQDISDLLFSHLAHIAAQRNIVLPQPIESKVVWLQQCINTIIDSGTVIDQPLKVDKTLQEYKTALNDLQFSYQYLSKEYEISRDSSSKLIQDYRKKINLLEKPSSDTLDSKDKEIANLRKELGLLKIDNMNCNEYGSLRKEFKKIVTDLQDQYELELSEERLKCRKLQDQIDCIE